jgi:hypothetical protein
MKHWSMVVQEYEDVKRESGRDLDVMTPAERRKRDRILGEMAVPVREAIRAGGIADVRAAISAYEVAQGKLRRAQEAEAKRYDPQRLGTELQLAKLAVDRAQDLNEVRAVLKQAIDTNESHKLRAVLETVASIKAPAGSDLDGKMRYNHLARTARSELELMRASPEVVKAFEEGGHTVADLIGLKNRLAPHALEHGLRDLAQELTRIQVNNRWDEGHGGMGGYERTVTIGPEPTPVSRPVETNREQAERLGVR